MVLRQHMFSLMIFREEEMDMAANVKVISQIKQQNTSLVDFYLVLGEEVRQIGRIQYIPGTGYADGVACNEAIIKVLQKVYAKRLKEIRG